MSNTETIKIKYFNSNLEKLDYIDGKSDWIDLRIGQNMTLKKGESALIPLGVGMKLPDGYEAHAVPRSSTFKKYGLIQTNSIGIIDNTYCGDEDEWKLPVYATKDVFLYEGERICQFRIVRNQPRIVFEEVNHLEDKSRGGFGSTGVN